MRYDKLFMLCTLMPVNSCMALKAFSLVSQMAVSRLGLIRNTAVFREESRFAVAAQQDLL